MTPDRKKGRLPFPIAVMLNMTANFKSICTYLLIFMVLLCVVLTSVAAIILVARWIVAVLAPPRPSLLSEPLSETFEVVQGNLNASYVWFAPEPLLCQYRTIPIVGKGRRLPKKKFPTKKQHRLEAPPPPLPATNTATILRDCSKRDGVRTRRPGTRRRRICIRRYSPSYFNVPINAYQENELAAEKAQARKYRPSLQVLVEQSEESDVIRHRENDDQEEEIAVHLDWSNLWDDDEEEIAVHLDWSNLWDDDDDQEEIIVIMPPVEEHATPAVTTLPANTTTMTDQEQSPPLLPPTTTTCTKVEDDCHPADEYEEEIILTAAGRGGAAAPPLLAAGVTLPTNTTNTGSRPSRPTSSTGLRRSARLAHRGLGSSYIGTRRYSCRLAAAL